MPGVEAANDSAHAHARRDVVVEVQGSLMGSLNGGGREPEEIAVSMCPPIPQGPPRSALPSESYTPGGIGAADPSAARSEAPERPPMGADSRPSWEGRLEDAEEGTPTCAALLKADCLRLGGLAHQVWMMLTWEAIIAFWVARLPFFDWLPKYSITKFLKDLQAGLVVGCMLIPQGMGYADVAGLPFVAGLYSGFAPLLVYAVFGTSRQMGVGPVAIVSLLVSSGVPACSKLCFSEQDLADGTLPEDPYPTCHVSSDTCDGKLQYNPEYWTYCTSCALMAGVIQVVMAPLLGFVMNFVPHPVISGFTSAGGLIIAMSQLKDVMGYPIHKKQLQVGIYDFFNGIRGTHVPTCVMGVVAAVFLYTVKKLGQGKIWWFTAPVHPYIRKAAKLPWAFLLVVFYILATYYMRIDKMGVQITGGIPSGLPQLAFPRNFLSSIPKLIEITIQIVIIGYLESIAVETKFATQLGYQVQPAQEAIAQGAANIIGGLTFAYPVVGSFSRSATNAAYESQSPMCNLITGLVIMLTLLFLTPLFYFMPKNVLAAIVIVAAVSLIDYHEAIFLWRSSKKEFLLLIITFCLTAFVALELGIYVSVGLCVAEVLFKSTRPKVVFLHEKLLIIYLPGAAGWGKRDTHASLLPRNLEAYDILLCRVEGDLNFSAASALKNIISQNFKAAMQKQNISAMVFDFRELEIVDTTALHALMALIEEIEGRETAVFIVGVPPGLIRFLKIDSVKEKLKGVDIKTDMGQVNHTLSRMHEGEHVEHDPLMPCQSHKRYQETLERAVNAAIREDGDHKRRRSHDFVRNASRPMCPEERERLGPVDSCAAMMTTPSNIPMGGATPEPKQFQGHGGSSSPASALASAPNSGVFQGLPVLNGGEPSVAWSLNGNGFSGTSGEPTIEPNGGEPNGEPPTTNGGTQPPTSGEMRIQFSQRVFTGEPPDNATFTVVQQGDA